MAVAFLKPTKDGRRISETNKDDDRLISEITRLCQYKKALFRMRLEFKADTDSAFNNFKFRICI
jgi:hypothetical protein